MNLTRTLVLTWLLVMPSTVQAQRTIGELFDADSRRAPSTHSTPYDLMDWRAYNLAGWRAIGKGYYDTAEHEFLAAIKAAKRPGLNDTRLIAKSYADYAWALQKQGRHAQAEPLAKWALVARDASFEPGSPMIIKSLNQLGTLYYEIGRHSEAEPLLRRAIESQATGTGVDSREHARTHTLMGLSLIAQRRYAEAEPFLAKSIAIRETSLGPSHPETGDALNNLAWTFHEQGKLDEAKPLFEQALKIFERSRGSLDPSVGHSANGLGQIASKRGAFAEAEVYFLRAISIWEKVPSGELSLLEVLRQYANLLDAQGRDSDLARIKARIAPLKAKLTMDEKFPGNWFRVPEPSPGPDQPGRLPG